MFINSQLESAQFESILSGALPAAASNFYRVFYLTDLKTVVVSDGVAWNTVGASEGTFSWEYNGTYAALSFPSLKVDLPRFAPFDLFITSAWIYNGIPGAAGTTEYDIKVASPGGAYASIFSTTGKITSAAASEIWTDSGVIVAAAAGVTKPVISTPTITAGQALKFDLITGMTTVAEDARIEINYRRV